MARSFRDRHDAGAELGRALTHLAGRPGVIVLALPRGGVPVGYEVAHALKAPLDVLLVRKLGLPGHEELAMGALASGGVRVMNRDVLDHFHVSPAALEAVVHAEQAELERREQAYRAERPPPDLRSREVVLVDDGLATGSTMKAAVGAVRALGAARIVVGVPVGSDVACRELAGIADEVVCVQMPLPFGAVGQWYDDFRQTDDDEVRELLREARVNWASG